MSRTPTKQQASCIAAAVDSAIQILKIEACAGAGKTSTLTMMAEANPVPSLYWCFNKANAVEAGEKFPKHVKCATSHSTAFGFKGREIMHKLNRPTGKYVNVAGTGAEIGRFYKLTPIEFDDNHGWSAAFIGLLVRGTVARFEQSADDELAEKHVPNGEFAKIEEKVGCSMSYAKRLVLETAKKLWADRICPRSAVLATHDTYLKMYQLSKPVLTGYEVLYVDEFQDTTPCVLDIVKNQIGKMKIIVVGDQYQSIYQFRGAINAMKQVTCETRNLTKSFRYGQAVADIATAVLENKLKVDGHEPIESVADFECVDVAQPYTRLFRSNTALLSAAVLDIAEGKSVRLEIDIKDFVKVLQSAIALKMGDEKNVKHDKILPFKTWGALKEEAKADPELNRISKVVEDGKAYEWIGALENHKNSPDAHITFTTAHKSKGREFSQVIVEDDFKSAYNEDGEFVGLSEEEQNLLYVACTRAINKLEYNQTVAEYLTHMRSYERELEAA